MGVVDKYCFWYVRKFGCFEARSIAEQLKSTKLAQMAKTVYVSYTHYYLYGCKIAIQKTNRSDINCAKK